MRNQIFWCLACFFILSSCDSVKVDPKLKEFTNAKTDYQIIPKVAALEILKGRFSVNSKTKVSGAQDLENEGTLLAQLLSAASGESISYAPNGNGNITLKIDPSLSSEEAYTLSVQFDQIEITGKTPKALFYGIQTLRQLLPPETVAGGKVADLTIPAAMIEDSPRFGYRGMHLDVCRNFFSIDFVKRYIDLMAMHKLNTFHWHLTEDQGWRIEIKKYPKLTEVGGWRNGTIIGHHPGTANDNKKHGGFYTQDQIKEVIAHAAKQHITIIPEIELPGHSSAAIAAYPSLSCFPKEFSVVFNDMMSEDSQKAQAAGQPKIVQETWGVFNDVYCAGKEETFTFVEEVLGEVMALFPSEYIHIGGDECPKENWKRCPHCNKRKKAEGIKDEHELQSYFINRVEKFVNSKGKKIIGWDEILEGGLAPNATVMSWRGTEGGVAASRADHDVIMSPTSHSYFNFYQSKDTDKEPLAIGGFIPVKKVYEYEIIPKELEADKQKYVLGAQGNLWTEYITTEDDAEYMLLPRMTALSEVLWSPKATNDWSDFKARLTNFKVRYDVLGLSYGAHVFEEGE